MAKKHETRTPDPKSADYQLKEAVIARFKPKAPAEAIDGALSDMGAAIAVNPALSNSQQDKFVQALISAGLLTYQTTYLRKIDQILESTVSVVERERLEAKHKLTLDSVAWDIEAKGTLQAQVVIVAWQLSQPGIERAQQIEIIAQLINAGHLATRTDSLFETPYDGPAFQTAVAHAEGIESEIFERRGEYGGELASLYMIDPEEHEWLPDMTIDDFRMSLAYDRITALHFLHQLSGQTVRDRFVELQPVLHFGYSIGVRDANQAGARNLI